MTRDLRGVTRRPTDPRPWRAAAAVVGSSSLALWVWSAADQFIPYAAVPSGRVLATNLALVIGVGIVVWLVGRFLLRRIHRRFPAGWAGVTAGSLVGLVTLAPGISRIGWWVVVSVTLVCGTAIGLALLPGRVPRRTVVRRRIVGAVAGLVTVAVAVWLAVPTGSPPRSSEADGPPAEPVGDLAAPGDLPVEHLSYGSGTDRLRAAYRDDIAFTTPPVDLSATLGGWSGGAGAERTGVWGFDAASLPLNGRVCYPEGPGPYPLVLVTHGNKSAVESSEEGFGALCDQLASHGTVVALIDQNFLATGLLDSSGGLTGSENARVELILEHFRMWARNGDLGPLTGKVDTSRTALIGHSRGGRAAADAAARSTEPGGAVDGAEITAVLALAPAFGPDGLADEPPLLDGVSYFAVQGSDDVDVFSFVGADQVERTSPAADTVRGYVYVGGADHSQFNTRWGRRDIGQGLPRLFVDTGGLITPEDQQHVTLAYASAFVRFTLLDDDAGLPLLADHTAGRSWLPATRYVSAFSTGGADVLLDVGGRSGVASVDDEAVTVAGGAARDGVPPTRRGESAAPAALVEPDDGADVVVTVDLDAPRDISSAGGGALVVDTALVSGDAPSPVEITVTDASGATASAAASRPSPAPVVMGALTASWMAPGARSEVVLQTSRVPIADLVGDADLSTIVSVSATVRQPNAVVVLDRLGFDEG